MFGDRSSSLHRIQRIWQKYNQGKKKIISSTTKIEVSLKIEIYVLSEKRYRIIYFLIYIILEGKLTSYHLISPL